MARLNCHRLHGPHFARAGGGGPFDGRGPLSFLLTFLLAGLDREPNFEPLFLALSVDHALLVQLHDSLLFPFFFCQ